MLAVPRWSQQGLDFFALFDVVGNHGKEDHAPEEEVIFLNHSFFSFCKSIDSIFSSFPRSDWPWTIRLTGHFVVTQRTSAPAVWATDYRIELVLQCSSNQCYIGPHIYWKVMIWAFFDVELQKAGNINPKFSSAKIWTMNPFLCILFLALRFAGKIDHDVGSTATFPTKWHIPKSPKISKNIKNSCGGA